jgi:hypothetical protein
VSDIRLGVCPSLNGGPPQFYRFEGGSGMVPTQPPWREYRLAGAGNGRYTRPPELASGEILAWKVTRDLPWEYGRTPPKDVAMWELWELVLRSATIGG